jgi:ATP-dependent Lon protease
MPDTIKNKIEIRPVKWIDQVLELALERMPEPLPEPEAKPAEAVPAAPVAESADATGIITH